MGLPKSKDVGGELKALRKRNEELEKFKKFAVDREFKIIELEERIKELEEKLTERG
jgi:hypothetical protein